MAPVLSALWGSEVAGSEVSSDLALVSTLTTISALLLIALLVAFCASCQGQKKASQIPGDHENLMNGVSEKETCSQSADTVSHGTDLAASSSHNGPLTSGTVLTDTMDTSPHPSEEMLSSHSEHRSSKCPQDRELPSIPCTSTLPVANDTSVACGTSGEDTYEVLKDGAPPDPIVEDSPYETVKDLKRPVLSNGTISPDEPMSTLPNGHASPILGKPDPYPIVNGAEYASIDLNKKSRYSADVEARCLVMEEAEDENPPPIPDKVLDENDNHNISALSNGEVSAVYSRVVKPLVVEKENDYSSIGEIRGVVVESGSSELYATVRDMYPSPPEEQSPENTDPAYETIKISKSGEEEEQQGNGHKEPDYESVGELDLNRETHAVTISIFMEFMLKWVAHVNIINFYGTSY
ncbi:phosphoprotein associated with glycosphingolipid-enriched microdomains 1 [Trichomycterus rosablanca]|uniref:phosphoprotein associated with glycosphingolipid-enriched microdomains 1 n=1 Tax=Trichomycterus rosablanca TaxID=2290929 RepID=UPI002F360173